MFLPIGLQYDSTADGMNKQRREIWKQLYTDKIYFGRTVFTMMRKYRDFSKLELSVLPFGGERRKIKDINKLRV